MKRRRRRNRKRMRHKKWNKKAMLVLAVLLFIVIAGSSQAVKAVKESAVRLSATSVTLSPATTKKLKLKGAAASKVKWSSSSQKIASVSSAGMVTAKAKGVAKITATYKRRKYACTVKVSYQAHTVSDGMRYKDTSGSFGRSGRWYKKSIGGGEYYFTNTGGGAIYFKVTGSKYVKINFITNTVVDTPYFAYSVDGGSMKRQSVAKGRISLGDTKTHYVRLLIDAISESEQRWEEAGVAIKNIKAVSKGGVVTALAPKNPVIAFYGDSITEGVRVLNMHLSPKGTSATRSYAWHCAERLGMVPYYAGYGGSGIFEAGSFQKCINAINNVSAYRQAAAFDAEVIVVLHGTNDVYTYGNSYVSEYGRVLKTLHKKHPDAKIMAVIPFNQIHADEIRQAASSCKSWCRVVETASWKISYTDGLHPNAAGAKQAGKNLAKEIAAGK